MKTKLDEYTKVKTLISRITNSLGQKGVWKANPYGTPLWSAFERVHFDCSTGIHPGREILYIASEVLKEKV